MKNCIYTDTIIKIADHYLREQPVHITDERAKLSAGSPNEYYSNGDYWWPDPSAENGLPYVVRDGETNPDNFTAHRHALRKMRLAVTHMAAAYRLTGNEAYAKGAGQWLYEFFIQEKTRMFPHLLYAQAIPGICDGRGIGIIDTLHLIDVPKAIETIKTQLFPELYQGLTRWFSEYLTWMNTHPNGIEERDWHNNHAVAWLAQASSFASFIHNEEMLTFCRKRYKEVILPQQMALDGSFPQELKRTKPYSYSCFVLDNMVNICLLASTKEDNLWEYELPDGRGINKGISFIVPFIQNKGLWKLKPDVEHDEEWPVAMPFLLFAGIHDKNQEFIDLWKFRYRVVRSEEVRRNIAVRCPYLFMEDEEYELLCV